MKKSIIFAILFLLIGQNTSVFAHQNNAYLTHKEILQSEHGFINCDRHAMVKDTTVYHYSNGTRRISSVESIINKDGSIIEAGCKDLRHYSYNNKHYFSFYKHKRYQLLKEDGTKLTLKNYQAMQEVAPNRIQVKLEKKYGIIDLEEKIITPIKYKSIKQVNKNLLITELNGYYGIIDYNNTLLVKPENDKITPLFENFKLEKNGKYGLVDENGKYIFDTDYDKIEKLDEYIIVKRDGRYAVFNSNGDRITHFIYKKIRLNRNSIEGKSEQGIWVTIT